MRFLCLHGSGGNSRAFEQQTATLRYELGERHTFEFVEGTIPWDASSESTREAGETTFSYCDPHQPQSCLQALHDLENYLRIKGPYDGVIAFSLGTSIVMTLLVDHARKEKIGPPPFKVAVLFSNVGQPCNMDSLRLGRIEPLQVQPTITIPTAHIWGAADSWSDQASLAPQYCRKENQSIFVHDGGHEIPTAARDVVKMANVIQRAIGRV
ncbi:hypothetical protein BO85DRAFT_485949 [Aspergillus piperis CBS 112811]|uniref:Serine hydrolase domain-containing protein n=1 Tax=Aspergillus piperis CBS 112811 TaxID=1448313 RepID=A0A8G1R6B3_9EURO|nr:hypothetical protein BO85DRAFT_485949 [Aspergillus piperis CBS 112811]RAH59476.1 hypothetical protein BO85DRAFT_485949 [Aspergillus piperis CBS 112811]